MDHRGPVVIGTGILIVASLLSSVFLLRNRQQRDAALTRFAVAQSLVGARKYDQAALILRDLKPTVTDKLLKARISYYEGVAALGLNKFSEAKGFFIQTMDLSVGTPLRPLALSNLGFAQEEEKDYEAATQTYGRFMAEYGEHFLAPRVQLSLGRALFSLGKFDEAKKALVHLIDLYPTSTWAQNARSIMDKLKTR
ncbi:MAG: hypothetical protein KCHDKBKB_02670 [Elusimicrobia bacterium]|nr:hypothetical protein [Elusimicrobiota bacterium]